MREIEIEIKIKRGGEEERKIQTQMRVSNI